MPISTENIRRWIEQSDIDYITHFIKAWIPFNAWYNANYTTLNSDREKINAIKNNTNQVRNAINVYLESEDQNGEYFRSVLSDLHNSLQQNPQQNRDGNISFRDIVKERNHENLIDNITHNSIRYYLKREDGNGLGVITRFEIFLKDSNGSTFFSYVHTEYDYTHLQASPDYIKLSPTQKENTRIYFDRLKPFKIIDAIQENPNENPRNYYKCDSYKFVRDPNDAYWKGIVVSKATIEILYQLRNLLFHGELIPNDSTQPIYKNAYSILKMILDRIR